MKVFFFILLSILPWTVFSTPHPPDHAQQEPESDHVQPGPDPVAPEPAQVQRLKDSWQHDRDELCPLCMGHCRDPVHNPIRRDSGLYELMPRIDGPFNRLTDCPHFCAFVVRQHMHRDIDNALHGAPRPSSDADGRFGLVNPNTESFVRGLIEQYECLPLDFTPGNGPKPGAGGAAQKAGSDIRLSGANNIVPMSRRQGKGHRSSQAPLPPGSRQPVHPGPPSTPAVAVAEAQQTLQACVQRIIRGHASLRGLGTLMCRARLYVPRWFAPNHLLIPPAPPSSAPPPSSGPLLPMPPLAPEILKILR
ncbi:MAG: hypothetical protein M1826_003993 [Phylliscum demangeonii]|nr:MAG: hypothetical protein M1826_003993 [Phylliscum demangeonii]